MGNHFADGPHRFVALTAAFSLFFTSPGIPQCAELLHLPVPPVPVSKAAPSAQGKSGLEELYDDLARILHGAPAPTAGTVARKLKNLNERLGSEHAEASAWIASRLESLLFELDPSERVPPDRLLTAQKNLIELKTRLTRGDSPADARSELAVKDGINPAARKTARDLEQALAPNRSAQEILIEAASRRWTELASLSRSPRSMGGRTEPPPLAKGPTDEELRVALDREEKLSMVTDLASLPTGEKARQLAEIEALANKYAALLQEPETRTSGLTESRQSRAAFLEGFSKVFNEITKVPDKVDSTPTVAVDAKISTSVVKDISDRVVRIEGLKRTAQEQLALRDAAATLLASADKSRSAALTAKRNDPESVEFRKNFSRLAMVMDLTYSLNLLTSAEEAHLGMLAMIDKKLGRIAEQRKINLGSSAAAEENRLKRERWTAEVQKDVDEDMKQASDFATLSDKVRVYVLRMSEFTSEVQGLLDHINARDSRPSENTSTAKAEYERRLRLLPEIVRKMTSDSGGSDLSSLTLERLQKESRKMGDRLAKLSDAQQKIDDADVEGAGVLLWAVPNEPETASHNPTQSAILAMLDARRAHWQNQLKEQKDILDSLNKALSGSHTARKKDDFGDFVPESLVVYRAEKQTELSDLKRKSDALISQIDEYASEITKKVPSATLPTLSGRSLSELRDFLPVYAKEIDQMHFPSPGGDPEFFAKMDKLALAKRLPFLADIVIRSIEAEKTIETLDDALNNVLPPAKARFVELTDMIQTVIDDIVFDKAYVNAGFPPSEGQALISRKRALLLTTIKPVMERMKDLLDRTLIPFQQDRIAKTDPNSAKEGMKLLYDKKIEIYDRIDKGLKVTLPWNIVTDGASEGNVSAGRANIQKLRDEFEKHKKTVDDLKDKICRRMHPDNNNLPFPCSRVADPNETEEVYGEPNVPYSLIVRKRVYLKEMQDKAVLFNGRAKEINQILREMDALYPKVFPKNAPANLASRYGFPTDVTSDPASIARLRRMADDKIIQNMAGDIKKIAEAAADLGGEGLNLGGSDGNIPTGTQPPLTLPDAQQLALLGLNAITRLVPTQQTPKGTSIAELMARILFSNGLVETADLNINVRIPHFNEFIAKADVVLAEIFGDFDADLTWITTDLSGGPAVMARKIRVYSRIRDTAKEGADLFNQKSKWSAEGFKTVDDAAGYYDTLGEVYTKAGEALDADEKAAKEFKTKLSDSLKKIQDQKADIQGWLKQLNPKEETAFRRLADNLSNIQEKTKSVLETNTHYHEADENFQKANKVIQDTLDALTREQKDLRKKLEVVVDLDRLNPDLARRVDSVISNGSTWLATGPHGPQTMVVPRGEFAGFLNQLFGAFTPDAASRDIIALRDELLRNPMALTQLIPNTKMVQMGEGANGFYLIYQSDFSTPHGLETTSQVTLGNVLKIWDNNVSVIGHRFASPPHSTNAPFGDQGVTVRVESLQGKNWVNYLDVTFHKFIQDLPGDLTVGSQAREARMMIFDDFALMLADGKLYFGAAGFADFALDDARNKPYYYGGNFKAAMKFNKVMSLNAEESLLFAKDPRQFLQTVNLDFTKYDPDMNKDFIIRAKGEDKNFRRDKIGVGVDIQQWMKENKKDLGQALSSSDTFKLDLFFARVTGTDEVEQRSVGATVLKGFEFEIPGVDKVKTTVSGTGELGEQYNSLSGRIAFELPNKGLVLSAQGKMLGDAETYMVELRKKLGSNSEAFVSYGSRYVGLNHRLHMGVNTSFTLGELWGAVAANTANAMTGGATLKSFNESIEEFFKRDDPSNPLLAELQKVFASDVGKRLLSLEIGNLTKDLEALYSAGALLDNTRVRGMIGFVTGPVSLGTAERAATGGFQSGVSTELTLTKTQKALVENKIASIYSGGLALQVRLVELTKTWQLTMTQLVEARWEMALAAFMAANAQDAVLRADAQSRLASARAAHRQAVLQYNALTGRGPDDVLPFDGLNPSDMDRLFVNLERMLGHRERLAKLLASVMPSLQLPQSSFNLVDWIPWVEQLTFYVGVQLQDMLSSQVLGAGVAVRLPIYDPRSTAADKSLSLLNDAIVRDMASTYRSIKLRAHAAVAEGQAWDDQASIYRKEAPDAANAVADAIRAYRNNLMPQDELWSRFRRWYGILSEGLHARAQGSLKSAWAVLDLAGSTSSDWVAPRSPLIWKQPETLGKGIEMAQNGSPDLEALALRSQAAQELLDAASRRLQKVSVDVNVGVNITAAGIALLPAFGLTGLGVFPIFNVELDPAELVSLNTKRLENEEHLYTRLGDKVRSDIAMQLYQAYISYRTNEDALKLIAGELLPQLERGLDGGAQGAWALDQARAQYRDLQGRQKQTLALINHLLGRAPAMPLNLSQDFEAALAELSAQLEALNPAAARHDVLASRLEIARAAEQKVDKNLKTQNFRFEPISLIGRSLGRLINALSGDGMASPELLALARNQTLQAQHELAAYEKALPALRERLAFELEHARRQLEALSTQTDPASKLKALALRQQIYAIRAMILSLGAPSGGREGERQNLPGSYSDLKEKLAGAYALMTPVDTVTLPRIADREFLLDSKGTLRWYDLRMSLDKTPIGQRFIEGWIEVRLKFAATPAEALVALARMQTERADQIHRTQTAQSRAKAELLLSRMRFNAALYKSAPGERGRLMLRRLEKDFAEVSSHLHLKPGTTLENFLALLPENDSSDPDAATEAYLREVSELDLNLLRRTLFQDGLPSELQRSADPLLQLRANMIAEKMSFKGFTPVGAFGFFRGHWVHGIFLEAPDPIQIQKNLENILSDALISELKAQDRLKTLALKLHSLMASVSDKVSLVANLRERLRAARRNLMGVTARKQMNMATDAELASAQDEATASHEAFIETLSALHMDFVYLVAELEALGYPAQPPLTSGPLSDLKRFDSSERSRVDELLAYWSERLLDPEFESRQEEFLKDVPASLREELKKRISLYRESLVNRNGVQHADFTPAEKLELLIKVDLQGRRERVEDVLRAILGELERQDPRRERSWANLMGSLRKDLESQKTKAVSELQAADGMRVSLREAYWNAVKAPDAVEAAYQRIAKLSEAAADAKQKALAGYLAEKEKPEDYLRHNEALDVYIRALISYDEAMSQLLASPEIAKDPYWVRVFNGLFGFNESLKRLQDRLRYGRGIYSLDASIGLAQSRLLALRWEGTDTREIAPASETLASLKAMRERWIRRPQEVESLYAVSGGKNKEKWLTEKELRSEDIKKRLVEVNGRLWLLPKTNVSRKPENLKDLEEFEAGEILAGTDIRTVKLKQARLDNQAALWRATLDEAQEKSEITLSKGSFDGPGELTHKISLEDLRRLERDGKVFYFEKQYDSRQRRLAVHAVAAQWRNPKDLIILVQTWGPRIAFDKLPSLEALEQSIYKEHFEKVEIGVLGAKALLAEAKGKEEASLRAGWLHLKLEGYAYALDKNQQVAAVYVNENELKEARKQSKDSRNQENGWTFHKTSDLRLGFSADKLVVEVVGEGFRLKLGPGEAARWISGDIYAMEMNGERVEEVYTDASKLAEDSASWWIEDMEGKIWKQTDKNISPIHRLKRYINPKTERPILLGRPILERRLDEAKDEAGDLGRWAYMPWNWPNIVLETPRGIIKLPVELITGRDLNQEGYIGRVYMYQTEGGETNRHGALGSILHFIDIFEILPDPVGRYMDPSQFPDKVDNNSPLKPGEWEHEKSPRTTDGDKWVHFGKGSLMRSIRYAKEDQDDARNRIMASFQGGVRKVYLEDIRGRNPNRNYSEARIENELGRYAVEKELRRIASQTGSDGKASLEAQPGHIAVDRVQAEIRLSLGAQQQELRRKIYEEYLRELEKNAADRKKTAPVSELGAAADLAQSEALRRSLQEAIDAATPRPVVAGFPLTNKVLTTHLPAGR